MSDTVAEETEKETAEEVVDNIVEEAQDNSQAEQQENEQQQEEQVPLSALKKERKARQEEKLRSEWLEKQMQQLQQQQQQASQDPQYNPDDLLTVGQQQQNLAEFKRSILEESYLGQKPDVVERIKNELPEILNDPRNKWLADSISQAPNRLERAEQVLNMFKPKKVEVLAPDRSRTPRSPQSVAKTNKASEADRIMSMSDDELEAWRQSQKRKFR